VTGYRGYRVEGRFASGGMAELLLARVEQGPHQGRHVVIKRIREHLADMDDLLDMFRHESRLASSLRHPNIVEVVDTGEADGLPFMVMEHLEGVDLRALLARCGSLAVPDACFVAREIAQGLAYAHALVDERGAALGLVHRDVSPHNVFVTTAGDVKVLDFGIAKTNRIATMSGLVRGKAGYMAPEQLAGLSVDARSDLFALGVVTWEMLAGRRLWELDSETGVARAIRDESPRPVEAFAPAAANGVHRVVAALLAKFPNARPRTAAEVARALAPFVAEHPRDRLARVVNPLSSAQ